MGQPASVREGRLTVEAAHYYARIYAAARAGCLGELRRVGCSEDEAEDIFATTFERIMRKFDPAGEGFREAQTVSLLKKACRQKLIDERRHRDVLRIVSLSEASERFDPTAESPTEAAEEREAVAIAREAVASLPERDRALFIQRHQLDLSPEEILSRHPGLSRRTYRKLMQRANARALRTFEEIGSGARCAEMREGRLHRYVTEEVSQEELRMVRAHLRHCRACCQEVARLHGHLHDVAAGLAAALVPQRRLIGDISARLLDAAAQGGEALLGAMRAARERLHELAFRVATAPPGTGGESAAGQLAGISGMKVASACAAGALTASCLAAGIVPGVGALNFAERQQGARGSPERVRDAGAVASSNQTTPAEAPFVGSPSDTSGRSAKTVVTRRARSDGSGGREATRAWSAASTGTSTRPTVSGRQTGVTFGAEAAGTGIPVPAVPFDASHGEDLSSSRGGETSHSSSDGSQAAEFGF